MSEIALRSLFPEDIDQIAGIYRSLTGSSRRTLLENRLLAATANPVSMFLHEIDRPFDPQTTPENFLTCAALDAGKIVGYGFARILEGEFGAQSAAVELDDFGVDPSYHGRGIGKKILAGIEERMVTEGVTTLRTQVVWSSLAMVQFFSATDFALAPGQILERYIAPGGKAAVDAASLKRNEERQVDGGAYYQAEGEGVTVRPLRWADLSSVDRIDAKLTGLDRSSYLVSKFRQTLDECGSRVSLVAEEDGVVIGFIMARADFGEFGMVEKTAVIDTIGVHPAYGRAGIGHALLSQLLVNLSGLQIASVRTKVEHKDVFLWNFLSRRDFKPSQRLLLTKDVR